jgi:hypothetical protein
MLIKRVNFKKILIIGAILWSFVIIIGIYKLYAEEYCETTCTTVEGITFCYKTCYDW